jgi:hypothetical protein
LINAQPDDVRAERSQGGNEMEREEEIKLIAYSLWVREGYPHGRAIEHWLRAEAIWEADHNGRPVAGNTSEEPEEEAEELNYAPSL